MCQPRETAHSPFLYLPYHTYLQHPQIKLKSGRSMVVGHVLMVHFDMIAPHPGLFYELGEHSRHPDFHNAKYIPVYNTICSDNTLPLCCVSKDMRIM